MTLGQSQKTFHRNSYLLSLITQLPPVAVSVNGVAYVSGSSFTKYKMSVSDLNNFTLIEKVTVTLKFATGGQEIGEKVVFAVTFDGAYRQAHDVTNGDISQDGFARIRFTDVLPGKTYTVNYREKGTGETYPYLSEKPFYELMPGAKGKR